MVSDKDINKILNLLPKSAQYYFCQPNIPRALNVKELHDAAIINGLNGQIYNSVNEAKKAALNQATNKDLIFIGGSTFVVAEVVP